MRHSYRPAIPPQPQPYRTQILDHLGLVAGMFDELGIGDVLEQATHQNPAMRDLTGGEAVKAMVLKGLGLINHARYLVPRVFQHTPTARLIAPRVAPGPRNDDALGRAFETLSAYGVTALYSLMATTAAQRLGRSPTFAHLDSPRFHVAGRYNCAEEPAEPVLHLPRGDSRDHRPDRTQGMLDFMVEPQAGMPVLMQPLSGTSRDAQDVGQSVSEPMSQRQTTYGTTCLVAASALYRDANLQQLAHTHRQWIPRVPAPVSEAQAARAQANPPARAPRAAGYRDQELTST